MIGTIYVIGIPIATIITGICVSIHHKRRNKPELIADILLTIGVGVAWPLALLNILAQWIENKLSPPPKPVAGIKTKPGSIKVPISENSEDTGSDFSVTTGTFAVKPDSVVPKTNCWHLHVNGPLGHHAIPVVVGPTIDEAMKRLNITRESYRLVDAFVAAWDAVPAEGTDVTIEYIGAKVVEEPAASIKAATQRFDAEFGDKDMSLFEKSVWEVVFYTQEVEMRYTLDGMDISEVIADVQSFIEKHKNAHVFKSVSIQRA